MTIPASPPPRIGAIENHGRRGVTAPRGFRAAGICAGIKRPQLLDLALVVSDREGPIAGLFTTNTVAAAPVILDREHLRRGRGQAIFVNSGSANACTGKVGLMNAREMADLVATQLNISPPSVFVGSTGVIGQHLPMAAIRRGVPRLIARLRRTGGAEAARAILTTDTKIKEVAVQTRIGEARVTVGGMAKGSGMVHPHMATMLAYLTTDAAVTRSALQRALRGAVDESLNCISIDGDTSTNDTVLCLANGMAGNRPIREGTGAWKAFQRLLAQACVDLARQVCWDGEGVTKVVRILVRGARSAEDARRVVRAVSTSLLVKTALFGEDANWGRIVAAAGRSGAALDPTKIGLSYEGVKIVRNGATLGQAAEREVARVVRRKEFTVAIELGLGAGSAWGWTTDLSNEYVKINASYRT